MSKVVQLGTAQLVKLSSHLHRASTALVARKYIQAAKDVDVAVQVGEWTSVTQRASDLYA